MDDCIIVRAVEAADKCSQDARRVAVALSKTQIEAARRIGISEEKLIAQTCAQAGLDVLRNGKSVAISASLCRSDTDLSTEMRNADEVRCPLSLGPQEGCPPLLCTLYACTPYSTSCYSILKSAESILAEERPPP